MDFNLHDNYYFTNTDTNTNTSWEYGLAAMEDHHHVLHHHHHHHHLQLPFDSLWAPPTYSLQTHHQLSTQPPINKSAASCFFVSTHEMENHHDLVEDDEEEDAEEEEEEVVGGMKEMMYQIAAMQPVDIDPATIQRPKRRNVRISDDPQSVAARLRRERISEKMRILQRLVPGGTKMDTSTMLDEAIRYVKFLKRQIRQLQSNPQYSVAPHCLLASSKAAIDAATTTTTTTTTTEQPLSAPEYGLGDAHPLWLNRDDEVIINKLLLGWGLFEQ